jgi:hypothetical protein
MKKIQRAPLSHLELEIAKDGKCAGGSIPPSTFAAAYRERNQCVAALCKLAHRLGMKVCRWKHEGASWDEDWRNIVVIHFPEVKLAGTSTIPNFLILNGYR